MSKIDWGAALKVGAVAGVTTGALLLAGPLLLGASATEAVGGFLAAGAARAVAGGIVGGIMGGAEAGVQGLINGDDPGHLGRDIGIGALSGAAGGVVGGFLGNPVIGNAVGNGLANFAGQAPESQNGEPKKVDWDSVVIATAWGASTGSRLSQVNDPTIGWAFYTGPYNAAGDGISQFVWHNVIHRQGAGSSRSGR